MTKLIDRMFGLRIRRAKDLVVAQACEAFFRTGIELDAKLTSIVIALYEQPGQSSSELATVTSLSRQLVESRLKMLDKKGYISSVIRADDARKRDFSLSRRGQKEVAEIIEMIFDLETVYAELWRELGIDLGEALLKLERALHAKPLLARLCNEFPEYDELIKVPSAAN